jgi:hypothetical protein
MFKNCLKVLILSTCIFFLNSLPAYSQESESSVSQPSTYISPDESVSQAVKRGDRERLIQNDRMKEKKTQQKEDFKEKVQNIKDEKKQAVVAKIDEKLSDRQTRLVSVLTKHLERLDAAIMTIEDKAELLTDDANKSKLTQQISEARQSIIVAKQAVETQSQKVYAPDVSSESRLKAIVSQTVANFRKDWSSVKAKVKLAQTNTVEVIKMYRGSKVTVSEVSESSVN